MKEFAIQTPEFERIGSIYLNDGAENVLAKGQVVTLYPTVKDGRLEFLFAEFAPRPKMKHGPIGSESFTPVKKNLVATRSIEDGKAHMVEIEESYFSTGPHAGHFQVPRWRMVIETGYGYDELTPEEKRLAKEYLCTDHTSAILESFREAGERIGREYSKRMDAVLSKVLGS